MPEQKLSGNILSKSHRRMQLFEAYISAMIQRKARRDTSNPLLPESDPFNAIKIRPKYSIQRINKYLGWLARRMSERSKSSVKPESLYSFLRLDLSSLTLRDLSLSLSILIF
ncbi:hypothetical protein, partial [Okeania hirsuta]|uniref:hypothetical protein n=1 Tax=Okeania hirsuta TaxID=1458930 RepID=UPI001068434E